MDKSASDREAIRAAHAIIETHDTHATRIACRRRRLRRALGDLGLAQILGPEWCRIGDDGFEFAPITARQADQLTAALEDLAERVPPHPAPRPGPGQQALDF